MAMSPAQWVLLASLAGAPASHDGYTRTVVRGVAP